MQPNSLPFRWLLFLTIFVGQNAYSGPVEYTAETCSNRDFSERLGEVRDQGSTGWCYAFVAADLVSDKLGQRISATDIALTSNFNPEFYQARYENADSINDSLRNCPTPTRVHPARVNSGFPWVALRSMNAGYCADESIPDLSNIKKNALYEDYQLIIESYAKALSGESTLNRNSWHELTHQMGELFPGVGAQVFTDALTTRPRPTFASLLQTRACGQNRIRFNTPAAFLNRSDFPTKEQGQIEIMSRLMSLLSQNRISGVSLNLDHFLVQSPNTPRPRPSDRERWCAFQKREIFGYPHALVIVGRRFNSSNGKCEIKLRNSWGTRCSRFRSNANCTMGYLYIEANRFQNALDTLTYLN